jgi:hypothetical protein
LYSSPLDGSAQFTVLSLLVALVAYIRNIPVKQLVDSRKNLTMEKSPVTISQRKMQPSIAWIDFQLFVLNVTQIFLVSISLLVAGRAVYWGQAFDSTILFSLFALASLFFIFHVAIDGRYIIRYLLRLLEGLARAALRL